MVSNNNPNGGILVPKQLMNEIFKVILSEGSGNIASLPRTIRRKIKNLEVPVQSNRPVFTQSAECKNSRLSTSRKALRKASAATVHSSG